MLTDPSTAELYRLLQSIDRTLTRALDGNGQVGLRDRMTDVESKVKLHGHPTMIDRIDLLERRMAYAGGSLAAVAILVPLLVRLVLR